MRVGHISDIHLRHHLPGTANIPARRSRQAPKLLEQALRAMRAGGVDLVAVTGDIVDIPNYRLTGDSRETLGAAVTKDYILCRDLLAASEIDYIVVPGNHDDQAVMRAVFATGTGFRDLDGIRFVSFWDREHAEHVPRRVSAESALFDQMLCDDHLQVHLQHFVITQLPATDYPYTYDDREEMADRIVGSGRVRLSLSGHYHAGTELVRIGDTYFSTVPALAEYPHRYRTYEVSETSVEMSEHQVGRNGG